MGDDSADEPVDLSGAVPKTPVSDLVGPAGANPDEETHIASRRLQSRDQALWLVIIGVLAVALIVVLMRML